MRCLIIDDEESPRLLMEHLVTRAGHKATAVDSAQAAIRVLDTEKFDVVLVDMEMPQHNGAVTISFLKKKFPNLPVLVVSGYDDPRHVMAALEAGADGYLVKDDLNDSLAECLHNVRAGQAPLSPRVAAIVVRKLRKALRETSPNGQVSIGRVRTDTPQ